MTGLSSPNTRTLIGSSLVEENDNNKKANNSGKKQNQEKAKNLSTQ